MFSASNSLPDLAATFNEFRIVVLAEGAWLVHQCLIGTNTPPRFAAQRHFAVQACCEVTVLLTEATVEEMFRKLFTGPDRGDDVFEQAEDLLDQELRPESPLRHRLGQELEEMRALAEGS